MVSSIYKGEPVAFVLDGNGFINYVQLGASKGKDIHHSLKFSAQPRIINLVLVLKHKLRQHLSSQWHVGLKRIHYL